MLWEWANDRTTRMQSFNQRPIPWSHHQRWFFEILLSANVRLWILESQGVPIGQIRYQRRMKAEIAYISFSVGERFRGRGVGTKLLKLTLAPAERELHLRRTRGITFASNVASQRAFISAGFAVRKQPTIQGQRCIVLERHSELTASGIGDFR